MDLITGRTQTFQKHEQSKTHIEAVGVVITRQKTQEILERVCLVPIDKKEYWP